jgi:hypothetical protein
MTTASPALQAAAPTLIAALTALKGAVTTIFTGDPVLLPARVAPALLIFDSQLVLMFPELALAEEAVTAASATNGITNLITKLQALTPAGVAAAPHA